MKHFGWVAALVLLTVRCSAQQVAWTYFPPAGHVDVSPAIGDVDGDGRVDVVFGTTAGFATAVDAFGRQIWAHNLFDAISTAPTVADVNADGRLEVLALSRRGLLECLDGHTGKMIWAVHMRSQAQWGSTSLAVGDLYGDGAAEIVLGLRDGTVLCLRGASGETIWSYNGRFGYATSPCIYDLDGDGQPEVLVGSEKVALVCLDAKGRERWRRGAGPGGSPYVYRESAKSAPVIVTGMGKSLCALDARGRTIWQRPMAGEIDAGISFADVDGDGHMEIFAVDLTGKLVCVDHAGKVRWTADVLERARRSPSIGDVDGDGKLEVLVAGYGQALFAFDMQGREKARVSLPGPSNGTPTIAVLGKSVAVVVVVARDAVRVVRWAAARPDARVLWAQYRRDAARSAVVAPAPRRSLVRLEADFGAVKTGPGVVRAVVRNPERRSLDVRIEAAGACVGSKRVVSAQPVIEAAMPYVMPADGVRSLSLTCRVADGRTPVARRTRTTYLHPVRAELAAMTAALASARRDMARLPDPSGVEDRVCLLTARVASLRTRVDGPKPVVEQDRIASRADLFVVRDQVKAVRMLVTAGLRADRGSTLKLCAANPWAPFGGIAELAEGRVASKNLAVAAFGRETEAAALNVFNLSNRGRTFRVEIDPLAQGTRSVLARTAITLHEVLDVPTERCDMEADALPTLCSANTITVPAWSGRQLWINVNTRDLEPGEWKSQVRLRSLDVDTMEASAPLSVRVWNHRMPEKHVMRNCGWGYVESSCLKETPDEALVDQVTHGTNVFVATVAPSARYDASGNLVGSIDYAAHDRYVLRHAPHGLILFCGYQGALEGPAGASSAAYRRAHVQWLRAWVRHLQQIGVGYDGYALYPVDEPGLQRGSVETYLTEARIAREADPRVQMYTDPVPGITVEELQSMLPYVDIWCPNRGGMVLDKKSAAKLAVIKGSGKPVWMYECDDNAKHQPALGYYRGQAWLAWQHGMVGIGFWSYCTSVDDPWFVPKARYDYLLIYQGNGVVVSKRWEAVRDGIEDFSAMLALRTRLNDPAAAMSEADRGAAQRVLGPDAARIAAYSTVEDDDALPGAVTPAETRHIADTRWAAIQRARAEIARLLGAR